MYLLIASTKPYSSDEGAIIDWLRCYNIISFALLRPSILRIGVAHFLRHASVELLSVYLISSEVSLS